MLKIRVSLFVSRVPTSLLLFAALSSLRPVSVSGQSSQRNTAAAVDAIRSYIESRLHWTDDFATLITWPGEPAWDCYWVAKEYRLGVPTKHHKKVVVPATYSRVGLYCHGAQFETQVRQETIPYEMVLEDGKWKVNGPIPDYTYVDWQVLEASLQKIAGDEHEAAEDRNLARSTIDALASAVKASAK